MPPRKRPLSEKPTAVRSRLRKESAKVDRDMEMLYQKPIEEWDMEELARGRPKNKAGNFQGPRPKWITPIILREAQNRLRTLTQQELSTFAGDAVKVMTNLMKEDGVDFDGKPLVPPGVRLSAATYVLDQIIGKPTQHVEVEGNVVLESLMAKVLVNPDGSTAHPVIDGEVVEDEEDDDDDSDDDG
jgi:hypothetical protein